jgi:hypothetical protein
LALKFIYPKQKFMKKILASLTLITMIVTACNKKNDAPAAVTPTKENLTATFAITSFTSSTSGGSVDMFAGLSACEKDDSYKLNADLTANYIDSGTKCTNDNSYQTDWELISATSLYLDDDTWNIQSFDGRKLTLTQTEKINNLTSTYTLVLTKK